MKNLLTISLLIFSLNAANFTNNGATITIGQGVTLRADGDFENNGTLINNGTFATSGQFSGEISSLNNTNVTFFGDATVNPDIEYNILSIEGNNSLEPFDFAEVYDLIVSGVLDLSEGVVIIEGNFYRDGGDISGQGHLFGQHINGSASMYNVKNLGFIIDSPVDTYAEVYRFPGMVNYHDRLSLNTHYFVQLNVDQGNQDSLRIGIALDDQDLNGMDINQLSIFASDGDSGWIALGGTVEDGYIMLNQIPGFLFDEINGNDPAEIFATFTVGQKGCIYDDAANYDPAAFGGTVTNNDLSMFGGEYDCTYDFTKELSQGVNLMSFYSMDDDDNSVGNVLSSLDQATDIIGEGVASNLHPILGWIGSVTEVERERGYWVMVYSNDEYEHLSGSPNRTDMSYDLNAGANLISYSGPSLTPIEDAIPEGSSCYAVIGAGVATTYSEVFGWFGSLINLEPWGGYWVKCTEPEMLQWQGHGALPRIDIETYSVPEEFAFEQSTQQAFYFIEQIEDAVVGRDIIIAKKGDDIVGSVVYSGDYTTVPVMGKWQDIPGYSPNEIVTLQLYNPDVDAYYYLEGQELQAFENLGINMVGPMTQLPVIPENFVLHNAYPNPFNPSTNIRFDLPNQVKVTLEVYNVNGQLVKTLKDSNMEPGYYEVNWDASSVASGAYFVKLSAGSRVGTQKIMLIK